MSNTVVAAISATIAAISAIAAIVTLIVSRRARSFEFTTAYWKEILDWHAHVVTIMMELKAIVRAENPPKEKKLRLLAMLSAQIEIGRFHFFNLQTDTFGTEKPFPLYRGYRNLILDFPILAYNLYSMEDAAARLEDAEKIQKFFSS